MKLIFLLTLPTFIMKFLKLWMINKHDYDTLKVITDSYTSSHLNNLKTVKNEVLQEHDFERKYYMFILLFASSRTQESFDS